MYVEFWKTDWFLDWTSNIIPELIKVFMDLIKVHAIKVCLQILQVVSFDGLKDWPLVELC